MESLPHRCQSPTLIHHQPHRQCIFRGSRPTIRLAVGQLAFFAFMWVILCLKIMLFTWKTLFSMNDFRELRPLHANRSLEFPRSWKRLAFQLPVCPLKLLCVNHTWLMSLWVSSPDSIYIHLLHVVVCWVWAMTQCALCLSCRCCCQCVELIKHNLNLQIAGSRNCCSKFWDLWMSLLSTAKQALPTYLFLALYNINKAIDPLCNMVSQTQWPSWQ